MSNYTKQDRILKFHYEEIIYVLLILATDLSKYLDKDLESFSEAICRVDVLFEKKFIKKLEKIKIIIEENTKEELEVLKSKITCLYSSQWHKKLKYKNYEITKMAKKILDDLNIKYVEPLNYSKKHMNIDW